MNRHVGLLILGLIFGVSPAAFAADSDTIVDVMTGTDPTARLQSGFGAAMGAYADQLQEPPAADSSYDPSQTPSLERSSLKFDNVSRDAHSSADSDSPQAAWSGSGYGTTQDSNPWSGDLNAGSGTDTDTETGP